jgi:hypothetical protein
MKRSSKRSRKLTVNRETVCALASTQLVHVVGADSGDAVCPHAPLLAATGVICPIVTG